MPSEKLRDYLSQHHVNYTSIAHPLAYSAREISHLCHVSENQLAKTVIVHVGDKIAMVVLPARFAVDFNKLKSAFHNTDVSLASETEFKQLFSDCELGAMPPFGNLYNIEVYVEKSLGNNKEIVFNAGTHTEVIKLAYDDFVKLVHPTVIVSH
ncbi:MAG: aminoacyl-tRNA deacylase [Candidatus Berkiella sp.]